MLQLKNIIKTYVTGDVTQNALNDVSLSFRDNEFVSILGQSGSGKTTLLNIIGGLDRYTSGDLIINGVSTREYKDSDWDFYRNNSIGFVFQSYNLIPHQTVLSNVEMALTLAGVSAKERKERAIKVLDKVGLSEHIHKRPNQMSGGQMQRVAIARALINNPDILLADEPTGALDSETSIQIMELLKEIAKDKLVVMVTHNPDLAEQYSTRIVKLKDGKIIDDSNPYKCEEVESRKNKKKKISMSFLTALSLSFNNLRTKKGRTLLTSYAGSIGIIGIALILALSSGMNDYIESVQRDTMTSYPITISSETIDVSGIMGVRGEIVGQIKNEGNYSNFDKINADYQNIKTSQMINSSIVKNNLTAFKKYLDNPDSEIHKYLGQNGIIYSYDTKFEVYSYNANGELVNSDVDTDEKSNQSYGILNKLNSMKSGTSQTGANFSEILTDSSGNISQVIYDNYELLYGNWAESYDEVILVVNDKNAISAETLYQLGLITYDQYNDAVDKIKNGENANDISFSYGEACNHSFYLLAACDKYIKNDNGTFTYLSDITLDENIIIQNSLKLRISGIVKSKEGAKNSSITTTVAYTPALTDYIIDHTNNSAVVIAQEQNPNINVLNGMFFTPQDNISKANDAKDYLLSLGISEKASFYKLITMYMGGSVSEGLSDEVSMAAALDAYLNNNPNEELLIGFYDEYIGGASLESNMEQFGKVSYNSPKSISIYTDSFENKNSIADCIARYNSGVDEGEQITYTDYVSILTSSLTTIIDSISYVLIAFVSISLIVSCIMIGIITHISVMERTKEIGILRAMGASKRNISQVFNAETFIIGCFSGLLGILMSLLLLIPINSIIAKLSGISGLKGSLPIGYALLLIVISVVITIIGGLIPSKKAANKDPVVALRTE